MYNENVHRKYLVIRRPAFEINVKTVYRLGNFPVQDKVDALNEKLERDQYLVDSNIIDKHESLDTDKDLTPVTKSKHKRELVAVYDDEQFISYFIQKREKIVEKYKFPMGGGGIIEKI